ATPQTAGRATTSAARGRRPLAGRSGRGDAKLDPAAGLAREDLEGEHLLAELGKLAEQQLPAAARASDAELLDPDRAQRTAAAKAGPGVVRRSRSAGSHLASRKRVARGAYTRLR